MNADDAIELTNLRAEKADRERRDAIMALPEARGREAVAEALISSSKVTAAQARTVLAAAPLATDGPDAYERRRAAEPPDERSTGKKAAAIMANHKTLCGAAASPRQSLVENMNRILAANKRG